MANKFKKALALVLAAAMVVTVAPAPTASTAEAAKAAKITGKATVNSGTTNTYKVKNVTKKQYFKVAVTGGAKSNVTVKKGSKTLKSSTKVNGTGKAISLKVKNTAKAAGKKYTLKVTVFNKSTNKKVKTVKKTVSVKQVIKTTAISLDQTEATIKTNENLTLNATVTPADSTQKITWTTSDASVATVANGVVTGKGAGTATITAKSGSYTATAVITVTADSISANMTSVKQTAANKFTATFDANASQLVTKDNLKVEATDKTIVIPVTSITFDATGTTADVLLSNNFTDKKEYEVTYESSSAVLVASVGDVASVVITTATAEMNVETPIAFALYDANGIDVTNAKSVDTTTRVEIDGTYTSADTAKASAAKITMGAVGDKATVTVTYNSNASGATDVVGKQEITCVEPTATLGTAKFYKTSSLINWKSGSAMFYLGLADSSVTVTENVGTENLYFYVADENGDAIQYDAYAVESTNEDIIGASIIQTNDYLALGGTSAADTDSGKFTRISISANQVGSASINVTATKNGKDATYVIPVSVVKGGTLSSMTITASKSTLSNSTDEDYYGTIRVKALDAAGNEITTNDNVTKVSTIADAEKKEGDASKDSDISGAEGFLVEDVTNQYTHYTAHGAKNGSYTIKVDVSQEDKTLSRSVVISVKKLADAAWTGTGVAMTYTIELGASTIDAAGNYDPSDTLIPEDFTTSARLVATANNLFAGYVRVSGEGVVSIANGNVHANDKTLIKENSVVCGVKYGSKYSQTGILFDSNKNVAADEKDLYKASVLAGATTGSFVSLDIYSWNGTAALAGEAYYVTDQTKYDGTFAKAGSYTVYFAYDNNADSKTVKKTTALTVKNSIGLIAPKVTVTGRVVDSFSEDDVKAVLKANVDLNNNTSAHESIGANFYSKIGNIDNTIATTTNLIANANVEKSDDSKTTMYVKYVTVSEMGITFFVPINTTFRTE